MRLRSKNKITNIDDLNLDILVNKEDSDDDNIDLNNFTVIE